ncbi:MAG: type VI secretion system TssO [Prevotella sp.]|nr:type VI secretion system TssO [Prevotella sp.]
MTKDETIWTWVKFTLLLLFSVASLYIILCKYIVYVPTPETSQLVKEIDDSEMVLADQKRMIEHIELLRKDIDSLNFDIQQVQRTSEIKSRISQLQDIYRQHDRNPKYLYGIQAYKTLQRYFDIREHLSYTISDNKLIEQDLEKIRAKI